MLDQLKLLEELQQLDARLHETEDTRTSLEAKLESLKEDVGRVESLLEGERQQLADARRYREELEASIKAEQEQLSKSKVKLQQVRTSKEYMASQREVDVARKSSTEREEELIKLMDAIEAFQQSIKVHDEELAQLKQAMVEEEKETAKRIETLEGQRRQRLVARDKLAATVRKDVLAKYETIRRRRGLAVVPAKNGVCTGCNMHLPPQLYNILHGANSIEHCPSCQRIVYFVPEGDH